MINGGVGCNRALQFLLTSSTNLYSLGITKKAKASKVFEEKTITCFSWHESIQNFSNVPSRTDECHTCKLYPLCVSGTVSKGGPLKEPPSWSLQALVLCSTGLWFLVFYHFAHDCTYEKKNVGPSGLGVPFLPYLQQERSKYFEFNPIFSRKVTQGKIHDHVFHHFLLYNVVLLDG